MDIEKAIKKSWDNLEAKIGQPLEGEDRKKITELAGGEPVLPEFVECYVLGLDNLLKAHDIFKRVERRGPEEDSIMTKGTIGVKAAQIATQRFQRRVAIAEFVLFSIYTSFELFIPLAKNEPLPKKRINWREMITEWNQDYPSDTMTSTTVFRITFYKILREEKILQEILRRYLAETEKFQQVLRSATEQLQQLEQSERFQELPLSVKEKYYQSVNWIYQLSRKEPQ